MSAELIASYWTIAGDVHPGAASEVSPWPIEERLEAAAEAGFAGVGLLHADLVEIERAWGLERLASELERRDLRYVELEVLVDWFADGERRAASDRVRADLLRAAGTLGARHVKVTADQTGARQPRAPLAEAFAALCADAAAAGTAVVLEPMPFSDVPDLAAGREVVAAAGAPNGALLLDVWHVARTGTPLADVAALPPGMLGHVELDDAAAQPDGDLLHDTIHNRRLCGEGELDLDGFLAAVAQAGYRGPFGVELISREQRARLPREAARAAFSTTAAVLARHPDLDSRPEGTT